MDFNRPHRDFKEPDSGDLQLCMVQILGRILDANGQGFGIVQGVPNPVEPVRVTQLGGLVSFIGGETNRLASFPAFDLNAAHAQHRVPVAGLGICRGQAAYIKANF